MDRRGYTLAELLAVIVILGILLAIIILNVATYLNKADEESYNTLINSIETSTELYVANHRSEFPQLEVVGSTFDIELNDLVTDGYIKNIIIDERTNTTIPLTTKVNITVASENKIIVELDWE